MTFIGHLTVASPHPQGNSTVNPCFLQTPILSDSITYQAVGALAISPNYGNDHVLLAAVWSGGVYCSTDGGNSWAPANNGQPNRRSASGNTLLFSPNYLADGTVFYGTWGENTDGGVY